MDSGPFSTPQPADRRAASRPEPAYRPKDPQPTAEEPPRAIHRPSSTTPPRGGKKKPSFKWLIKPAIIVVLVALVGLCGWTVWSQSQSSATTESAISAKEYQAVFFTNGQVYFGKLHSFNSEYLKLTDIFYLQTQSADQKSTNPQDAASSDQTNVQLIKLGDEIHGPQDEMIISRDQVLFFENLKPNGKVAQSIAKYKTQK